jgi:hypothetical protein
MKRFAKGLSRSATLKDKRALLFSRIAQHKNRRQFPLDEDSPRSVSEMPDHGLDPAEPDLTAQRDCLAAFLFATATQRVAGLGR